MQYMPSPQKVADVSKCTDSHKEFSLSQPIREQTVPMILIFELRSQQIFEKFHEHMVLFVKRPA